MATLASSVRQAAAQLEDIIERVCGACGNTCCHQGTMMGSADLRRLYKGILLEPEVGTRLQNGLRSRAQELRRELAAVEEVAQALTDSHLPDKQAELALLEERLADWRDFCDRLENPLELNLENLSFLLRFSALRSNALRVLREFPGAAQALAQRGGPEASFLPGGRRLSAPRCLFLISQGCLAGIWKPAKCANFFCTGQPNLLDEIAQQMSFEEFVRGNFRAFSPDQVLRYVEIELGLGREFVEPKIIVEPNRALREGLLSALEEHFIAVEVKAESGPFMWSIAEAHTRLSALPPTVAYVIESEQIDGGALYELAVALDRLRIAGTPPAFYLLAEQLTRRSFIPHPLWADQEISQPLGFLDLLAVELDH